MLIVVFHDPSVGVVVFRMMGFVEDEQTDLSHADERMHEALRENFSGAYDDHVLGKVRIPGRFAPKASAHGTADGLNALVKITLEHVRLLKDKIDGIHLVEMSLESQ
jgi:hypothetical protein